MNDIDNIYVYLIQFFSFFSSYSLLAVFFSKQLYNSFKIRAIMIREVATCTTIYGTQWHGKYKCMDGIIKCVTIISYC